ncbi:MAG TPA: autotransporter outer membrane beta-barrel domain-containing protein [Alphaproteobacteria bacterium]
MRRTTAFCAPFLSLALAGLLNAGPALAQSSPSSPWRDSSGPFAATAPGVTVAQGAGQGGGTESTPTPTPTGRSQPGTPGNPAVWFSAGWTNLQNSFPGTAYHGNSYNGAVGGDAQIGDRLILGLAVSGEGTILDTTFNAGHLTTTGAGLNPYAVYTLTDHFYVDALVGWSWLTNDLDRSNGAVTASYDSFRWLGNLNLTGRFIEGPWQFLPTVGYLYVHQNDDAYTERGTGAASVPSRTSIVGQGRLGGKVGYTIDNVTPYVGARWEHNFVQPNVTIAPGVPGGSPSSSREGAFVQVGMNADFKGGFSGGIEFNTMQKSDQATYGILGNVRYAF